MRKILRNLRCRDLEPEVSIRPAVLEEISKEGLITGHPSLPRARVELGTQGLNPPNSGEQIRLGFAGDNREILLCHFVQTLLKNLELASVSPQGVW